MISPRKTKRFAMHELGQPVRIEIVKSIVKEGEVCQFAIHLPDDL